MVSHKVTLFSDTNQQSIDLIAASVVTIGRGFFQCQDKRVSRNHGTITVAETAISVKSCHTNPIFYKLNDQPQTKILTKDSEVTLKHQDKFSLLPNEFEYEVRVIEQADEAPMTTNEPATASSASTGCTSAGSSSAERKRSHEGGQVEVDAKRLKPTNEQAGSSSNDPAGILPQISIIKPDPDQLPSEPSSNVPQQFQPVRIKPEPLSQPAADSVANSIVNTSSDTAATVQPAAVSVANLANTSSNANVPDAKVKPEPAQPAPAVAPNPIRPSCNHGVGCYLNSADHRREHAHPEDADYRRPVYPDPPSGTPACPFAASCYRRNPEHFMRLSHPPASQYIAHQPRPAVQNIARQVPLNLIFVPLGDDDDDDDDEEQEDFDDSLVKTHPRC